MIRFNATCFDGRSSQAHAVTVEVEDETVRLNGLDSAPPSNFALGQCRLSEPPGSSIPALLLPDGIRCETDDQEAVASLSALLHRSWSQKLIEHLERRWGLVLICLVTLVLSCWLLVSRGIPALASQIAYILPPQVSEILTQRTLAIMDRGYFDASKLPFEKQNEVRQMFAQATAESTSHFDFRLEFRNSPKIGANAFALPGGLVVVTDQLIELAEEEHELMSVFVHERAHIENRHALRSLLQNAGAFFLISALVGDIASVSSTAATLPTLLLETGYSRAFEHEADAAVADYFVGHHWSTEPAAKILERLASSSSESADLPLLSTHPPTRDRILFLRQFDQGMSGKASRQE